MLKHSWLNPKLEVKRTKEYGKGIFAKEDISKSERLAIFGGSIIKIDEIDNLPEELTDLPMQIEERFVICSVKSGKPEDTDFFNHSCEPNSGIKGQIFLVAIKNIKKDEEVTFDYAMVLSESIESDIVDSPMECKCGDKNCRKNITDNDWKIPELQKKYKGYFSQYLQEKIDAINKI